MFFSSIKRIIRSSFINLWRQGGLSFATCFILIMAISLITSLFILKDLTGFLITGLQEKIDISVYFKNGSSEEDILRIRDEVGEIPEVKSVEYVSQEQALENFIQKHEDEPLLIESITEIGDNPFLASLNIKAWQFNQYQKVSEFLSGLQTDSIIEKVDYYQRKPIIERISALTGGMRTVGIVASIILSIVAVLITFNTIRLAILNQKEEISIQRLVGASNSFIRAPFLVQGAISGIFAALISLGFLSLICWALSPRLENLFSDFNLFNFFSNNFWSLFLIQLAVGIGLGVLSSLLAIRRYLRV